MLFRALFLVFGLILSPLSLFTEIIVSSPDSLSQGLFSSFTGRVTEDGTEVFNSTKSDSPVVATLRKGDYVLVTGERGDLFSVAPTEGMKGFIFRCSLIEDVVEVERTPVRQTPSHSAAIIGYVNKGDKVLGEVSKENRKWFEIVLPDHVRFFIPRSRVAYAGDPSLKEAQDKKRGEIKALLARAMAYSRTEMAKPIMEVEISRMTQMFQQVIDARDYCPEEAVRASEAYVRVQNAYLLRKVEFLEAKEKNIEYVEKRGEALPEALPVHSQEIASSGSELLPSANGSPPPPPPSSSLSFREKTKLWEPVEQRLFLSRKGTQQHLKTIDDFYEVQKQEAREISGWIEEYKEPVQNKPGDYLLIEQSVPIAYLYSLHVDLHRYVGRNICVKVVPRDNHRFAFPAYYVLEVK